MSCAAVVDFLQNHMSTLNWATFGTGLTGFTFGLYKDLVNRKLQRNLALFEFFKNASDDLAALRVRREPRSGLGEEFDLHEASEIMAMSSNLWVTELSGIKIQHESIMNASEGSNLNDAIKLFQGIARAVGGSPHIDDASAKQAEDAYLKVVACHDSLLKRARSIQ